MTQHTAAAVQPLNLVTGGVIIYGERGCGKSRCAKALARFYGKTHIVDEWFPGQRLAHHELALVSVHVDGAIPFADAMAAAGLALPADEQPLPVVRLTPGAFGTFMLFDKHGLFIGQSAPPPLPQAMHPAAVRTAAARMAYADELCKAAKAADMDFEATGTVSTTTINLIRNLLTAVGNA